MAIFHITVWHAQTQQAPSVPPTESGQPPVWQANILAHTAEESYRIGKTRFALEHPDKNVDDYTIIASGDSVEKSISV